MRTVFPEPSLWSYFVQGHMLLCKLSNYDCCVNLQVIGHHMGKPLQIFSQIVVALCIGGTSLAQVQPFASVKLMQLHVLHASFRALLIFEKRWSKLFCRSLHALEMCMQLTRPYQREHGAWSGEQCWCFLPLCQVCLLPDLSLSWLPYQTILLNYCVVEVIPHNEGRTVKIVVLIFLVSTDFRHFRVLNVIALIGTSYTALYILVSFVSTRLQGIVH